jgi:aminopeptidase N
MKKVIFSLFIVSALFYSCGNQKNNQKSTESAATESYDLDEIDVVADELFDELGSREIYRASETVFTDLIHTKLEVSFDWTKSQMNGKAYITAKPHFYPSDSLILDAKGMDILSVKMDGKDLSYIYQADLLKINLGKEFKRTEKYTIEVVYLAKPDERITDGSAAITSDKGLFFINPRGEEKGKMPQIWTQGETESSSVWFPTIDAPNVKTSQEIFMTVDDKYITLSNGKLISSKKNADGTRTDHWKQELPHAPYLFMMAVGEFKVIKDFYTKPDGSKMAVNYYVEKEWENYAKDIFGETPTMIAYFSKLLKVDYPWDKYDQIVVRDYVSGAMENTGAVVFGDYVYKTKRELFDDNDQSTIAHELFHHWFGDLVTAESWSNLTLNESFANYSQYLWDEFKFGVNEADYQASNEENGYYQSAQMAGYHDLVWFDYEDKEQMFDGHSYNKGGRILHMLRSYLGDEAFFEGLSKYLKTNAYKSAEFQQLRLAFEEVCGEDLNWFFNQWYLSSGHPILEITQTLDSENQNVTLTISQNQDANEFGYFRLPVDVAVFDSNGKTTHRVIVDNKSTEVMLPFNGTLKSVIFDEQKMLLAKTKEVKPREQYIFEYYNSNRYKTRSQSLTEGFESGDAASEQLVLDALNDEFWKIRNNAIEKSSQLEGDKKDIALKIIQNLAVNDSKSAVRAAATNYLAANMNNSELKVAMSSIIETDQSYMVVGAALKNLSKVDPKMAMVKAKSLEKEESTKMLSSIAQIYGTYGEEDKSVFFNNVLSNGKLAGFDELSTMNSYTMFNSRMSEEQIESSLITYGYLNANGGYYTKMFMGQNIDYMLQSLEERKVTLTEEIEEFEKNKDVALADKNRKRIEKIKQLTLAFENLLNQD